MKVLKVAGLSIASMLALIVLATQLSTAQDGSLESGAVFAIDAEQEVPSPTLDGATPSGTGAFVLNADGSLLGFTFNYSGLTGDAAAMHFHNGPSGEAGGVVQTICGQGPEPKLLDNCPEGTSGTIAAVWAVPEDLLSELTDGNIYINIHTAQNGAGEIRGQVTASE